MEYGLGREVPGDFRHVEKYPLSSVVKVEAVSVEHKIKNPYPAFLFNQGEEGACVGFGCSRIMSFLNHELYDPWWLWNRAKETDEWPDTNPGDDNGTSVRAALEILRTLGHKDVSLPAPILGAGIESYHWATNIDEMRGVIALGVPIVIGINWYSNFDQPIKSEADEYWIGLGDLGHIRGGHCVVLHGASDKRQAFRMLNSWGKSYPPVWLPYDVMDQLRQEDGEVGVVVDLPGDPDPGDYIYIK